MIIVALVSKSFRVDPPVVPTFIGEAVTNAAPEFRGANLLRSEQVLSRHERSRVLGRKPLVSLTVKPVIAVDYFQLRERNAETDLCAEWEFIGRRVSPLAPSLSWQNYRNHDIERWVFIFCA
jgi:hypothetical protein